MDAIKDKDQLQKEEYQVYRKSKVLTDNVLSYCPGCGHGTVTRLVAEAIEGLNIQEETIGIASVGCSAFIFDFLDVDFIGSPHGRAAAVACGAKRTNPGKYVFTYQGDGDLAAIGTSETFHACNRGDNITIIFVNNGIYGMTGGQMAPTTLLDMKTSTSPFGRESNAMGYPVDITRIVAQLPGTYYATRQSVHTPAAVRKARKAIQKAFDNQRLEKGLSIVELVSTCNMNWRMSPVEANHWMEENMFPFFPPGDYKIDGELVNQEK